MIILLLRLEEGGWGASPQPKPPQKNFCSYISNYRTKEKLQDIYTWGAGKFHDCL